MFYTIYTLLTPHISGNMNFVICIYCKKWDPISFRCVDSSSSRFFKCGRWLRLEMGRKQSENQNLVTEMELWVTNCALFPFLLEFYCVLCFCNFGVCTKWQFLLLLRILTMTQMTVQLCDSILCDCTVMLDRVHFRQIRKAFLNNDSSYYVCPLGLPSTWNSSAPTAQSRAPTLTCQFFEPLA